MSSKYELLLLSFDRYTTHDVPFSLPVSASRDDLSHLINQLLETDDTKVKEFDFLISGALVRNQLGKTIEQLNVNTVNERQHIYDCFSLIHVFIGECC